MSTIRKKVKYAKFLHDILCKYIMEAQGKSNFEKENLYHDYEQQWKKQCFKVNTQMPDLLNQNAFKAMVDKKFVEYTKKFFPGLSITEKLKLRFNKHSF